MYRLKHLPTGMYYKPGEATLSPTGKVYVTKANALSGSSYDTFMVTAKQGGRTHKKTASVLDWQPRTGFYQTVKAETKITDWIQEKIV